jgi:hypothetical protein
MTIARGTPVKTATTIAKRHALPAARGRQLGLTLMEAMISLALSLVVTMGMVMLMANSLGTATRIIHASQLTDELRNAMSMMTRDVRRANYTANAIFCYGNSDCGEPGGIAEQTGDIVIANSGTCFTFTLDRGFNGNAADDAVGGFRRMEIDGVGIIEMWTGASGTAPNCGSAAGAAGWLPLTDANVVNVTEFTVNDDDSFTSPVVEGGGVTFDNRQRQVKITLQGQLVLEESLVSVGALADTVVERRLEDTIYVRNDYIVL